MRHPDRQAELAGQSKYACNMVAMFMGNQDAGQIGGGSAKTLQAGHGFPQPEAAVEHQASCPMLDKERIPRATAAERGKTDHCNC